MQEKKTVLITGGGGGIGYELATLFRDAGCHIVVVSLLQHELESLQNDFSTKALDQKVIIIQKDLADIEAAQYVFDECEKQHLDIDILVNNAGFGAYGQHIDISMEKIVGMLRLNVITATELCTLFGRKMKVKGCGHILITASMASFQPLPFLASYAGSKSYVSSFAQAFREEMAPFGVTVSCLCPGTTNTNFLKTAGIENDDKQFSVGNLAQYVQGDPRVVAKTGYNGLYANKCRSIPGWVNKLHFVLASIIPNSLIMKFIHFMLKRGYQFGNH